VGTRPTFEGSALSIETFVIDHEIAESPQKIEIHLRKRLRDEMKFPSPEALREQIQRDIQQAREFIQLNPPVSKTQVPNP
jgi:riboflavin kinase/FMN adenylyltransferase